MTKQPEHKASVEPEKSKQSNGPEPAKTELAVHGGEKKGADANQNVIKLVEEKVLHIQMS